MASTIHDPYSGIHVHAPVSAASSASRICTRGVATAHGTQGRGRHGSQGRDDVMQEYESKPPTLAPTCKPPTHLASAQAEAGRAILQRDDPILDLGREHLTLFTSRGVLVQL